MRAKILFLDIETKPLLAYVWSIWEQNVGLNQIKNDWSILSFSAKWSGDAPSKVIYKDLSKAKDVDDDRPLLKELWKLLDQADVIVTQNGKAFDQKKIFARMVLSGMQPPSSFKHIDTKQLAKKHFGFTSNKLEYLSDKLCTKYKKLKHAKFSGFELWKECMRGNQAAWREMEKYNKHDVLALEELYQKLIPWDDSINFNLYHSDEENICKCGSTDFKLNGWTYTSKGKYQRYRCVECGAESRGQINHFSEAKKQSLRMGVRR